MNQNKYLEDFYGDLPSMTKSFTIEVEGKITGKRYVGEFTSKIPNTKDQCLIAKHRAFLNGEYAQYLDAGTVRIHTKLAYLRFVLTEYPKFWLRSDLGYELVDHNVVDAIYEEVLKYEDKWMKEVWGDAIAEQDGEEQKELGSITED